MYFVAALRISSIEFLSPHIRITYQRASVMVDKQYLALWLLKREMTVEAHLIPRIPNQPHDAVDPNSD